MSEAARNTPAFVVGIGASAGGLEALVELLGALPPTGMAFIVVQHLDPTHESLLQEILAKKTTMAVSLASAGDAVKPDHVYVIAPDALLTVHEGLIEVKRRTSAPERPFPVDLLFSSLAVAYGEHAIGVVLSGADADGSNGVRDIKLAGGFTFAQHPESARFPPMPGHAIETGCVDFALRPKEIAGELARLSRRFRAADPNATPTLEGTRDAGTDDQAALAQIFQQRRPVNDGPTTTPPAVSRAQRVMIVDDNESVRKSLTRLASRWGHEIAVAADGSSALSLADAFRPQRAIVDLSMPGMTGIDLARRLRQQWSSAQLRLIAFSGYTSKDLRDACLAAGFDAVLVKPGDISELERLLAGDSADSGASPH